MSKLQKRLIIVFCIGVFLCGIGAGVAFTEFSALTYGGKQIIGTADVRTENFDTTFESGEDECSVYCPYARQYDIQVDNSVPKNTVRFCVTYNAACIEPHVSWNEDRKEIVFSSYWIDEEGDMPIIMEAKDIFLQNLKEGKLVSFDRPQLDKVTILVNEASKDDVRLMD